MAIFGRNPFRRAANRFGDHYLGHLASYAALATLGAIATIAIGTLLYFYGGDITRYAGRKAWELSGGKAATEAVSKAGKAVGEKAGELKDDAREKASEIADKTKEEYAERKQQAREKIGVGVDWVKDHGGDEAAQKAKELTGAAHDRVNRWKDAAKERLGRGDKPNDQPSEESHTEEK